MSPRRVSQVSGALVAEAGRILEQLDARVGARMLHFELRGYRLGECRPAARWCEAGCTLEQLDAHVGARILPLGF